LILVFLIVFPFLVGALTESSPFGVARGERMVMRGESVRWQAVMLEVFILGILAMSYNIMFGFTGVLSFGHAMFFGMGGYILGIVLERSGLDPYLALPLGILAALTFSGVMGLFIGLVSLRLKGVYFAIFTLAIAEMVWIYFSRWQFVGAEDGFGITAVPQFLDASQSRITIYYIGLTLFALTFLFIRRLMASPTGAVFKAIRENEERVQFLGLNSLRFKLLSIILASSLATLAGMLQILLNKKVGPEILAVAYTVDPLLMTIIGGVGTLTGPVLGSAGLHLLDVFLREQIITLGAVVIHISDVWSLFLGLVFIIVVMIFPTGMVGTYYRLRARWNSSAK
jgi:branched-chain amino acid transport system permease protein